MIRDWAVTFDDGTRMQVYAPSASLAFELAAAYARRHREQRVPVRVALHGKGRAQRA